MVNTKVYRSHHDYQEQQTAAQVSYERRLLTEGLWQFQGGVSSQYTVHFQGWRVLCYVGMMLEGSFPFVLFLKYSSYCTLMVQYITSCIYLRSLPDPTVDSLSICGCSAQLLANVVHIVLYRIDRYL